MAQRWIKALTDAGYQFPNHRLSKLRVKDWILIRVVVNFVTV
jgi:hypothetical protein